MKSLAKALIIIACIGCGTFLTYYNHAEMGTLLVLFGGCVAIFYEASWK